MKEHMSADLLGYAASLAVLATFLMRTMRPLRVVAIVSNILFLTYGLIEHLEPIFILHVTLLPINVWRLLVHWNDTPAPPPRADAAPRLVRAATTPYAVWFAVGLLLGLIGPLPLLLIVGTSEAARSVLSFQAAPANSHSNPEPR